MENESIVIQRNIKEKGYKPVFREIRSLKIIYKKSEYLIQIQKISKNNNEIIYLYFPYYGTTLYNLINTTVYDYKSQENLIKWLMFQILKGLETLHSLNIIHRDINPKHILISADGSIKISDFSNSINDIESKFILDKVVGELAYIAPEVLLLQNYNSKVDIWGAGIIMLELYFKKTMLLAESHDKSNENNMGRLFRQLKYLANFFKIPFNISENNATKENLVSWLYNAKFDQDKFNKIFENIPDLEKDGIELLKKLLTFNPKERISAKEALKMDYFQSFQNFNKDEFKKRKQKLEGNEDLTKFLKNLEKEYQNIDQLPQDKKNEILKNELVKIFQ
jgi:serine/threonine protein kinase